MALKKNLDMVIYEKLYEEILRGNWSPEQPLVLDDLAANYGVSRTPVQQALKRMHAQGMVRDIIEVRLLLERQAIFDIQHKGRSIDFGTLEKLSSECAASNMQDNIVQARRTDLEFHRVLVEQADNGCLNEVYHRIQGQFMVANYLLTSHTRSQQRIAADDHEKILRALRDADYARAQALSQTHIQDACDKIIGKMGG